MPKTYVVSHLKDYNFAKEKTCCRKRQCLFISFLHGCFFLSRCHIFMVFTLECSYFHNLSVGYPDLCKAIQRFFIVMFHILGQSFDILAKREVERRRGREQRIFTK